MKVLGEIEGLREPVAEHDGMTFDDDDFLLYALLTDPVYMPELLWRDPPNRPYAGCYRVRDYQYRLNRMDVLGRLRVGDDVAEANYAIADCARAVGKTESEKSHAEIHCFDGNMEGQNLLITAPELIHLLPLTDAIEDNLRDCRLIVEMLDTRNQQTGFTHRPFGVKLIDGTQIVGRIPKVTGTGVKAQHQPRLIVEEGQDYPERGWTEVNETVNYDSVDERGRPTFRYWVYGVHGGNKTSSFDEKARSPVYRKIRVTQLMRPDWNADRKANAIAAYGGSGSPDYRRNIYGEPGAGANAYFVTARVMSCVDQEVERGEVKGSKYNTELYQTQKFSAEELDSLGMDVRDLLDLPEGYKSVWAGMDVGLTDSPTVISIFAEMEMRKKKRLGLIRRFMLERFRTKTIRQTLIAIAYHFGPSLKGFGMDITGLGFPMWQELEDDELVPPHLLEVSHGYMFNAKVEVGVDKAFVTEDNGVLKDQYGSMVKKVVDPATLEERYIVMMPFIAASTRYVREWVDNGYLLLPFDTDVTTDMLAETKQRVEHIGRSQNAINGKKGDRFHILDSFRAAAMTYKHADIAAELATPEQEPVLETAPDWDSQSEREALAMEATIPGLD